MAPEPAEARTRRRKVAFVTYTMANPYAVGVFFRALRLAFELHRRGWAFEIHNVGPIPDDPKLLEARGLGEIKSFGGPDGEANLELTRETLRRSQPDLIVFGEEPFPGMEPFYDGARAAGPPFVVLDQFYNRNVTADRRGLDLLLLYGLKCLWEGDVDCDRHYRVIPPFIDQVTPRAALPLPPHLRDKDFITLLGFDERVLRGGIALIAELEQERPAVVTLSRAPEAAEALFDAAHIPRDRRLALPLQPDPELFGWMAASRVVILANGFMQMMEALALGCPAVCIDRGIGMPGWSLDDTFVPYISIGETMAQQCARLEGWLASCPFTQAEIEALARERHGARVSVDHLQNVVRQARLRPRLERACLRLVWNARRLFRRNRAAQKLEPAAGVEQPLSDSGLSDSRLEPTQGAER